MNIEKQIVFMQISAKFTKDFNIGKMVIYIIIQQTFLEFKAGNNK